MANLGNENTSLFYHCFKNDFINCQLNPARIYPCFILYISKDLLMAKFIVQEYIRVLIFKKLWFYPCIYPWPVTFFRHKSRKNYWRILGFINELS